MGIFWGVFVVLLVSIILKILNRCYIKNERNKHEEYLSKIELVDRHAPYDEYVRISKKISVSNTPIRVEGDFLDFILPYVRNSYPDCIENKLSYMDCGEKTNGQR